MVLFLFIPYIVAVILINSTAPSVIEVKMQTLYTSAKSLKNKKHKPIIWITAPIIFDKFAIRANPNGTSAGNPNT